MFSTRIPTAAVTLIAALSFAGASLIPTAAQAQWHTYCMAGHCITHTNFTIGGVSPCTGISSSYDKAYEGLLEAIENKKEQAGKVHPEMTQTEAQEQIEEAEASVHAASLASFEWGCDVAAPARTSPVSVKVQVTAIMARLRKMSFTQARLKLASVNVASASLSAR
jgi:hypothetical protein